MRYHQTPTQISKIKKEIEEWQYDQYQVLVRMQKNWNSYTLLVGMKNGAATLESSLVASFFYIKLTLYIWPSSRLPPNL